MLPDRVSNPGPLTYESGALPIALRGPAYLTPVTLTFNLPEKCFIWHFSSSRTTAVQNFEIHA